MQFNVLYYSVPIACMYESGIYLLYSYQMLMHIADYLKRELMKQRVTEYCIPIPLLMHIADYLIRELMRQRIDMKHTNISQMKSKSWL